LNSRLAMASRPTPDSAASRAALKTGLARRGPRTLRTPAAQMNASAPRARTNVHVRRSRAPSADRSSSIRNNTHNSSLNSSRNSNQRCVHRAQRQLPQFRMPTACAFPS